MSWRWIGRTLGVSDTHIRVLVLERTGGIDPAKNKAGGVAAPTRNSKPLSEKSEPLAGRIVSEREPRAEEAGGHPADTRTDE
jgi:hypothetical protein